MIASATAWIAIVQRSGCGISRSMRPDLMCEASATPAMKARSGHRWASAAAHLRSDPSMAKKITLAVWTLANTPPRVKYVVHPEIHWRA
jgi:hypothetical protein